MAQIPAKQETSKAQNIHFQIVFLHVKSTNSQIRQGDQVKLSINRGKQMFEQTKNIKVNHKEGIASLNRARLNFIVFAYDPSKDHQFSINLYKINQEGQKCYGEYCFDSNSYANMFLQTKNGAFLMQININSYIQIDAQIYVGTSRFLLQKFIREISSPKSKIGVFNFQTIQQKILQLGRDRSISPLKRENPFKRNSPKKQRVNLTSPQAISRCQEDKKIKERLDFTFMGQNKQNQQAIARNKVETINKQKTAQKDQHTKQQNAKPDQKDKASIFTFQDKDQSHKEGTIQKILKPQQNIQISQGHPRDETIVQNNIDEVKGKQAQGEIQIQGLIRPPLYDYFPFKYKLALAIFILILLIGQTYIGQNDSKHKLPQVKFSNETTANKMKNTEKKKASIKAQGLGKKLKP